jgi:hypothetical protein
MAKHTTAADMALAIGVDPNAFREALRSVKLLLQRRKSDWKVQVDSKEYSAMRTVLVTLLRRKAS